MANWWDSLIDIGAAVLPAVLGNQGADAAARAANAGSQAAVDLSRDVNNRNFSLATPGYLMGGDAANKLGSIFGLAPQDYSAAIRGASQGGNAFSPSYSAPSSGSGNPVNSDIARSISSGIGGAVAGPIGAAIGNALPGGIVGQAVGSLFNTGPNWRERGATLGTAAPAGYAYDEYFNSDPNLASEWAKPDVQRLFNGNRDAYLYWHANGGVTDGRQSWAKNQDWLDKGAAAARTAATPGIGAGGPGASGGNAFADPMGDFWKSPYGQLATSAFRNIDTPEIDAAYAPGGKVLSGARDKALDDRGRARAGGAFADYTGNLQTLAGMTPTATSFMANSGNAFAANAGNAFAQQGINNANAATAKNNNWQNALKRGAEAFY